MTPQVIRAGQANMFLSELFTDCFVNTLGIPVEMYNCDGSVGAAIGAGLGVSVYKNSKEAFRHFKPVQLVEPNGKTSYEEHYNKWLAQLEKQLANI
jgi:xylulokinase